MNRIALASTVSLITACGGGVPAEDAGPPVSGLTVDCVSADVDGDGLPDCEELARGSSPRAVDSDGDGLSDFDEIVTRRFDPETNNYRFNPAIADLPRLRFTLTSLPDIRIDYTTNQSTTGSVRVERSQESARTVTQSESQTQSYEVEQSITTMSSISVLDAGFSVSGSLSESWGSSMTWSKSQSRENRRAYSRALEQSRTEGTELLGGHLRVTLGVQNIGYQSVRLEQLVLAALRTDGDDPTSVSAIANLEFESAAGFTALELPPNGTSSDRLIFGAQLDLGTALGLLADSRNLTFEPTAWSALDIDGRSFNAPLETIGTRCARIEIDFGPGAGRPSQTYFVSTEAPGGAFIDALSAMQDVLRIPVELSGGAPRAVQGVDSDPGRRARWVVVHTTNDGVQQERTVFDPEVRAADLAALSLRPGWSLRLVYLEDGDADGLFARAEFLAGTSDADADTDDDGLDDAFEAQVGWTVPWILDQTRRVFSSPLEADADVDGLDDAAELAAGTDPGSDDSDRDGIRDDFDPTPNDVSAQVFLPLDGNSLDASPRGLHFTAEGATPDVDRFGDPSGAMRLTGDGRIFTDRLFERTIATGAAWSLWFRPDALAPDTRFGLLDHDTNDAWNALWVSAEGIGGSGSSFGRHFIGLADGTGNVTSGWHHVVGVLEDRLDEIPGAETFSIYYDGTLRGQIPNRPGTTVDPGAWILGGGVGRTGHPGFVGALDDVRIYGRSLSADEVRVLYRDRR